VKTLITIDFDFYVPERPEWDLGHSESLLFLKMLWASRAGLIDEMKTDGNEKTFWKWLGGQVNLKKNVPFYVSDSHCFAYALLDDVDRVITFDAHHDCWADSAKGVYCHNWLRVWLEGGKGRKAMWVKPGWLGAECTLPEDMAKKVKVETYTEGLDLGLEGSTIVHICRSGCWVPPWLDKAFLGFLRASGRGLGDMTVQQDGEWNPMAERW
jgi:hypothetical protein